MTNLKYLVELNEDRPQVSPREGFGEALLELGEKNKDVVVLTADVAESVRAHKFAEKYPDRFFDVGVAEQNLAGASAGFSLAGKIPFMASYAVFSPGRNWDQIRVSICYSQNNVKIVSSHAGLNVGPDGATHQALEDVAITRVLPNMTVMVPSDAVQVKQAVLAAAKHSGPVYIRFGRDKTPVITDEGAEFEIGKAIPIIAGSDATIIACGPMVATAIEAAEQLKDKLSVGVINMATIKPLDEEAVLAAAKHTGAIVTAEDHQIIGGLGSAVAEILSEHCPTPLVRVGVHDQFGRSGQTDELMAHYHLTADSVIVAVERVIGRKKNAS